MGIFQSKTSTKKRINGNTFLLIITVVLFVVMYGAGMIMFEDKGFAKPQMFLNLFIDNAGLLVIAMTIISNTIKLTVHARRKEISIMKYVGATNGFIRTPFMIEGIIIGLMAGVISILLVGGIYNLIANKIMTSPTATKIGIDILSFASMSSQVIIVYLILGIGIGMIGSSISMKKYLEV